MRRFLLLAFLCASVAAAQTCNPTNVTGCPSTIPGTPGSTTPTPVPGTTWTANGVTDSVDVINQAEYNHPVCPGINTTGGGGCTVTEFMPHSCSSTGCSSVEIIYVQHGGGGSAGNAATSDGFASGTGCCQRSITYVQQYLGAPNAAGGVGIAIVQLNYRLSDAGGGSGANVVPAQWQDAKCGIWHIIANSSTFPGNKSVIGTYGASWGAVLVGWVAATSDTLYTASCDSAAPSVKPTYRGVGAWAPTNWLTPTGNASFDNVNQTCAYQNAVIGQLYLGTDPAITGHCVMGIQPQSYTPSTVESTLQAHYAAMTPPPDLIGSIPATSLAVLSNPIMYQFGASDILVMPYWNVLGYTTLTTGGAAGGNLYNLSAIYASTGVHPFMGLIPGCGHECDTTLNPSPSQVDAFNFLLGQQNTASGGLSGAGLSGN